MTCENQRPKEMLSCKRFILQVPGNRFGVRGRSSIQAMLENQQKAFFDPSEMKDPVECKEIQSRQRRDRNLITPEAWQA